ncbi:enoyl-CoA hydratase/isomerase family protein, partial [Nocardioides sp. NPDC057577]|uniref:enoyl-CoA hydratase/isomerase family protein n=1 Tax=Nocardioides sp. NPDC057577 TaxID=3346171 RepID=UPI0036713BDB
MSLKRERGDHGIEVLRIDRPSKRNALDSLTLHELISTLDELTADPLLRVVILSTTSVDAFCAGADVTESLGAEAGIARMEAFAELYRRIEHLPVPTVAVCVGNCVGAGAEIVAGCDLRVAGGNLKLAWAGARLGVPVGPARLTQLVGLSRAKELIYTGRAIDAAEAASAGLVHRVVPADQAESVAREMAGHLAGPSPEGPRYQ